MKEIVVKNIFIRIFTTLHLSIVFMSLTVGATAHVFAPGMHGYIVAFAIVMCTLNSYMVILYVKNYKGDW